MPLTIRVETVKKINDSSSFDFTTNQNDRFSSFAKNVGGLLSFQVAKKVGYGINNAIGAYTMNYRRQGLIENVMNTTDKIFQASMYAGALMAGNWQFAIMGIGSNLISLGSTLFYDEINTRNANFQARYLQSIVGSVRKPNGRIGI